MASLLEPAGSRFDTSSPEAWAMSFLDLFELLFLGMDYDDLGTEADSGPSHVFCSPHRLCQSVS